MSNVIDPGFADASGAALETLPPAPPDELLRARVLGQALAAMGRSPEEMLQELEIGRMTFNEEVSPRVAMAVLKSGMMGTSASLAEADRERASALAVATVLLGESQPAHLYYVDDFQPHESDDTVAPEVVEAWLGIPAGRVWE